MLDQYFWIGFIAQALIVVWLLWTTWLLPWEASEILALRRVGSAFAATIRDRVSAAIRGKQ